MITEEMIKRINELAKKKKQEGLTLAEKAEQQELYKVYLAAIRGQVTAQLDEAGFTPQGRPHVCQDGCCEHHQHGSDCNHRQN